MTTKTDYSKLTDQELDELAGEMVGEIIYCEFSNEPFVRIGIDDYGLTHNENMEIEWCPCDPDSNQAERYLFPKILEKNADIACYMEHDGLAVNICWTDDQLHAYVFSAESIEKLNRTKVIACLEAWEKLK